MDDDPEDRAIFKEAMELKSACDIINFAENGVHALEILNNNLSPESLPCLIVLDLNMPKMNGTETLRNLKLNDRYKHIPVIIYSTSINPLEKEKCMLIGAHDFITKPISFSDSLETAEVFLKFCSSKFPRLSL